MAGYSSNLVVNQQARYRRLRQHRDQQAKDARLDGMVNKPLLERYVQFEGHKGQFAGGTRREHRTGDDEVEILCLYPQCVVGSAVEFDLWRQLLEHRPGKDANDVDMNISVGNDKVRAVRRHLRISIGELCAENDLFRVVSR